MAGRENAVRPIFWALLFNLEQVTCSFSCLANFDTISHNISSHVLLMHVFLKVFFSFQLSSQTTRSPITQGMSTASTSDWTSTHEVLYNETSNASETVTQMSVSHSTEEDMKSTVSIDGNSLSVAGIYLIPLSQCYNEL